VPRFARTTALAITALLSACSAYDRRLLTERGGPITDGALADARDDDASGDDGSVGDGAASDASNNGCVMTGSACYYSQTITIQNANATALTNHQVRIDLPATNPIFTPMHLASAAGNDVRIVQADGTTAVPYWIESLDSGNAANKGRIWVKVSIPANSSIVVYLRYGDLANAASARSNIFDPVTPENGVMEWGDDFSGTVDTQPSSTRWAAPIPATDIAALSGSGELLWKNTGTSTTGRLKSLPTFTGSIIQEVKFRSVTRFGGGLHCAGFYTSASDNFGSLINPTTDFYRNNSAWSPALSPASADNIDYRLTLQALQEVTTIGGGTATATGTTNNLEPNGPVTGVFDGNAGAYVRGGGTTNNQTYNLPVTIAYQYPSGATHSITSYSIQVASDAVAYRARNPQNWTLQGSDDGSTWATVDTRTTADMPGVNDAWVTYTLPAPSAPYQRFRLNITRRFGNDPYIAIAELVLNEAPLTGTLANYATSANVYSYSVGHVVAADPVALGFRYDDDGSGSYTNQAGDLRFDWILTRKYAAIPPTVTVPTTED